MNNNQNFNLIPAKFKQEFLQSIHDDSVSHAYIFVSEDETTSLASAMWLTCAFLCDNPDQSARPDLTCANCRRVVEMNHPDVFLVDEQQKQSIGIDSIRPLKIELSKSPVEGNRRFFIIKSAQKLTDSAANAMLNILEEPVAPVLTILTTNNINQILPTIRSRVQIITIKSAGIVEEEIGDAGELPQLKSLVEQVYSQLQKKDALVVLTIKEISDHARSKQLQDYVLDSLLLIADEKMVAGVNLTFNQQILSTLLKINQMRSANVSFNSCLQYLILNIEF